jgi:ketosteroid isomerase-like protein
MLIFAAIEDKIRRLRTEWESRKNPPTLEEMRKNEEKRREHLALRYVELPHAFKSWKWSESSDSEEEEFSDDDVPFGSGRKDNDVMVFVLPPEK